MMTKKKTSHKQIATYLLGLPLLALLTVGIAAKAQPPTTATTQNERKAETDQNVPSISPVRNIGSTSGYGHSATTNNSGTKKTYLHAGMDFSAPLGAQVFSTASGVVTEASFKQHYGNLVAIKHSDEYSTIYAHLQSFTVKAGDEVKKGQAIGYVGNTGKSIGPHLHYEVRKNGEPVDPAGYMP